MDLLIHVRLNDREGERERESTPIKLLKTIFMTEKPTIHFTHFHLYLHCIINNVAKQLGLIFIIIFSNVVCKFHLLSWNKHPCVYYSPIRTSLNIPGWGNGKKILVGRQHLCLKISNSHDWQTYILYISFHRLSDNLIQKVQKLLYAFS